MSVRNYVRGRASLPSPVQDEIPQGRQVLLFFDTLFHSNHLGPREPDAYPTWGDPVEGLLTDRFPGGAWIDRHLDLGLHLGAWGVANWLISYDQRPWEQEANFLSRVSSHRE